MPAVRRLPTHCSGFSWSTSTPRVADDARERTAYTRGPTQARLVAYTRTGRRTFRLDRITAVTSSDASVHRTADFDLAESWRVITDEAARNRAVVEVHANCAPEGLSFLQTAVGDNLEIGDAASDGRFPVVIHAPSEYGIAGHLAGLVEWLEITRPQSVRTHLVTIGEALTRRYTK
ncbi:helix-turn-helix transcriptional regulator [Georgenia sp. MJ170]|uniref:helix-turn-helix transcriptional regulator n=1 Tax=Georgenia sunbinii TaxID=3117728 RepID=UPI002F26C179